MKDLLPIARFAQRVKENIETVFIGKSEAVEMLLTAFLASGHVLLEDVPGTGKTILSRAFAASLGLGFARIQCTPDLLPADILGVSVWRQSEAGAEGRFEYRPGPIVNQFVLVDEINRATPRTQSALLEAMAEGQITADGQRRALPSPFFVMATENPVEFEGTFPLPEAQKDRFLLTLSVGYPAPDAEAKILEAQRRAAHPVTDLKPVSDAAEAVRLQADAAQIHVDPVVRDYLLSLVNATRSEPLLRVGVSPRGSLALYRAAQAYAAVQNRSFVTPEDVKQMAAAVFKQRLLLTSEAVVMGREAGPIIRSILDNTPVPEYRSS